MSSFASPPAPPPLLVAPAGVGRRSGGQLIENTAAEAIEIIKTNDRAAPARPAIQRVLQTNFDLPYMGQTALAPIGPRRRRNSGPAS